MRIKRAPTSTFTRPVRACRKRRNNRRKRHQKCTEIWQLGAESSREWKIINSKLRIYARAFWRVHSEILPWDASSQKGLFAARITARFSFSGCKCNCLAISPFMPSLSGTKRIAKSPQSENAVAFSAMLLQCVAFQHRRRSRKFNSIKRLDRVLCCWHARCIRERRRFIFKALNYILMKVRPVSQLFAEINSSNCSCAKPRLKVYHS